MLRLKTTKEITTYMDSHISIMDVLKTCGIEMVKSGANWAAFCPFHDDKTSRSLILNGSGQYNAVKCFGCCDHAWYPINFYMKHQGKERLEAIEDLAKIFTIDLSIHYREPTKEEQEIDLAYKINLAAAEWLHKQLQYNTEPNHYLLSRYDLASINKWKLGYCKDGNELTKYLYDKCQFDYQMVKKVAIIPPHFTDRVIYPIFDKEGNVVGFSNRIWGSTKEEENRKEKESGKKFLNTSANSIVFKEKSNFLQGLHFARQKIHKEKGTVIIVEGCSDVIAMHRHGFENCVAILSLGFNKNSVEALSKISARQVIFCLDGDSAGQKGTLELLKSQKKLAADLPTDSLSINYKAISMPRGYDPDVFLETPDGIKNMQTMLKNSMSLPEFYMHRYPTSEPQTITEKIDYVFNLRKELLCALNPIELGFVNLALQEKFNINYKDFEEYNTVFVTQKQPKSQIIEGKILAWLVQDKEFRDAFINTYFTPDMFSDGYTTLFKIIQEISNEKNTNKENIYDEFNENQINIDLILRHMKHLQILHVFKAEANIRTMLLQSLGNTVGLMDKFRERANKKKLKLLFTVLNDMLPDYPTKEILKFVQNKILPLGF